MSHEFNCASCGAFNPSGNTHCYNCMSPRPIFCHHCKVDNNPAENTHCYNCGHALNVATHTTYATITYGHHGHGHHNHHNDDIAIDLNGDGYADIIID